MSNASATKKFSFTTFFKNLFSKKQTPKLISEEENIDSQVAKALTEIDNIIRDYAFSLVYTGKLVARYLDIRIASDMKNLLIANTSFEKPIFEQDEDGKFTYPPTENPQKSFEIITTQKISGLSEEARQEYLQKLWLRLMHSSFTVCPPFRQMKDSDVLFTFTNLGQMEDHHPDMMMFTDF